MKTIAFHDFWSEFMGAHFPEPFTTKGTLSKVKQVGNELGEIASTVSELTDATIRGWRDSRPDRAPQTFNGLAQFARSACEYAHECGYIKENPFDNTNFRFSLRGLGREHPSLDLSEIDRLLVHLEFKHRSSWKDGRLYALALVLCHLGLRPKDALRLRVDDFDFDNGCLSYISRHGFNNAVVSIPIPPACLAALRDWSTRCGSEYFLPGTTRKTPWVNGSNGRRPADDLDAAAIEAGLEPGTTLLVLRRSVAPSTQLCGLTPFQFRQVQAEISRRPLHGSPPAQQRRVPRLWLNPDGIAHVYGNGPKPKLTPQAREVVWSLVRAEREGLPGVTGAELAVRSRVPSWWKVLRGLKQDPDWDRLILFPGKGARLYRLAKNQEDVTI